MPVINIFRRVRQRFLTEGQLSRYLLYAIGEIILVVIGILIALQINNWNEDNKTNNSINSHLTILEQNLLEDKVQLEELRISMNNNLQFADSLLLQIQTILPVDNKIKKYLIKLILEYQFSPNTNAMETITQSNEMPYLKTELRTAILNYYALIERTKERELISNTQINTKYENHLNNVYPEIFQKDNEWEFISDFYKNDPRPISPVNPDKLLGDKKLEPLLVSRYFQSMALRDFYNDLITAADEILKLIEARFEFI